MKQPATSPSPDGNPVRPSSDSLRAWEVVFLILLTGALLTAFWVKSQKEYLGHDEFFTAVLSANPNLWQSLDTIRNGGQTYPPLYFVLEWMMARGFGTGDVALRALSALSMALAGVVIYFTLRRATGPPTAALAVALVFGLSRTVFWYGVWARCYGLFVLLAALAAWLFVRGCSTDTPGRRDRLLLFLVHAAMVYLHFFGLMFSGMFLVAQLAGDWLRGRWCLWRHVPIVAAWATFLFWAPALPKQLHVTSCGTWSPDIKFGLFLDEPAMQTPLATVLLLLALLALAGLVTRRERAAAAPGDGAGTGLIALLLLGLAWMAVMVGVWAVSQVTDPIYQQRYLAPCVVALTLLLAVAVWAIERLPQFGAATARRVPGWVASVVRVGVIAFCLVFQPLRAICDPPKPPAAFTDLDFGHPNLPVVFEDSMDFFPRAWYGHGREYILLIDHEAAEASEGFATKQMERLFSPYRAHHPELKVYYTDELLAAAESFLVVDVARVTTWDWVAGHHPELRTELLGSGPDGQKIYLVQREKKR